MPFEESIEMSGNEHNILGSTMCNFSELSYAGDCKLELMSAS
jgi:hypothetical protein